MLTTGDVIRALQSLPEDTQITSMSVRVIKNCQDAGIQLIVNLGRGGAIVRNYSGLHIDEFRVDTTALEKGLAEAEKRLKFKRTDPFVHTILAQILKVWRMEMSVPCSACRTPPGERHQPNCMMLKSNIDRGFSHYRPDLFAADGQPIPPSVSPFVTLEERRDLRKEWEEMHSNPDLPEPDFELPLQ